MDTGIPIIPDRTLIFLDEIQRAPKIFAKLRYFYEKRNAIHIIAAGSLLDFILADHTFSMPVGRIEYLYMGPMNFTEFLSALDNGPLILFIERFKIGDQVPAPIHEKLLDLTRLYMGIGGMPAVVREYVQSGPLSQCERELSSILDTLRETTLRNTGRRPIPISCSLSSTEHPILSEGK